MLHPRRRIRNVLCLALAAVFLFSGSALASVTAKVNCAKLAVFSSPEISKSAYIGCLNKGTTVEVTAAAGDWCRVEQGGYHAYTLTRYLSKVEEPSAPQYIVGYANRNTVAYKKASTSSGKVCSVPKGTKVYVVGYSGNYWKVSTRSGSVTAYIPMGHLSKTAPVDTTASALAAAKSQVIKVNWFDKGRKLVSTGSYYYLYDIRTATFIRVKYTCGTNHMDIEPATAEDTAKLKKAYGGSWSWDSRSVILIAGGYYVAAAINGMPHGETDTISGNGMDGVICLHMTGSLTHGSESTNESHQAAINAAYNWAHS